MEEQIVATQFLKTVFGFEDFGYTSEQDAGVNNTPTKQLLEGESKPTTQALILPYRFDSSASDKHDQRSELRSSTSKQSLLFVSGSQMQQNSADSDYFNRNKSTLSIDPFLDISTSTRKESDSLKVTSDLSMQEITENSSNLQNQISTDILKNSITEESTKEDDCMPSSEKDIDNSDNSSKDVDTRMKQSSGANRNRVKRQNIKKPAQLSEKALQCNQNNEIKVPVITNPRSLAKDPRKPKQVSQKLKNLEDLRVLRKCKHSLKCLEFFGNFVINESKKLMENLNRDRGSMVEETNKCLLNVSSSFKDFLRESLIKDTTENEKRLSTDSDILNENSNKENVDGSSQSKSEVEVPKSTPTKKRQEIESDNESTHSNKMQNAQEPEPGKSSLDLNLTSQPFETQEASTSKYQESTKKDISELIEEDLFFEEGDIEEIIKERKNTLLNDCTQFMTYLTQQQQNEEDSGDNLEVEIDKMKEVISDTSESECEGQFTLIMTPVAKVKQEKLDEIESGEQETEADINANNENQIFTDIEIKQERFSEAGNSQVEIEEVFHGIKKDAVENCGNVNEPLFDAASFKTPKKNASRKCDSSETDTDFDSMSPMIRRQHVRKAPVPKSAFEKYLNSVKNSRRILNDSELHFDTKTAERDEKKRLEELKQKSNYLQTQPETSGELLLDVDTRNGNQRIFVDHEIASKLKAHQIDAVKFMYDNCYGSAAKVKERNGSGCILAHFMGLGKTFSVIALLSAVIKYPQLYTSRIIIICPKSTVLNWRDEFRRWLGNDSKIAVFWFKDNISLDEKMKVLERFSKCGENNPGCLLIGYETFRGLIFKRKSKNEELDKIFEEEYAEKTLKYLCEDPDLVICDEGHALRNETTAINRSISQIKTKRRIILTGTPIQNNLIEYFFMLDFVKPKLLGLKPEFANRFANPIKAGQHADSSPEEIKLMKQQSFILHNKLEKFIQRREVSMVEEFLPKKYEYCIYVPLTTIQQELYEYYIDRIEIKDGRGLLGDYHVLRKIWTHISVLKSSFDSKKLEKMKNLVNSKIDKLPEMDSLAVLETQSIFNGIKNEKDWWSPLIKEENIDSLLTSNKFLILFQILQMCQQKGEKVVVFSSYVKILSTLEYFLNLISNQQINPNAETLGLTKFKSTWIKGLDYLVLDGGSTKNRRHKMCADFNNMENKRLRLFLISAKAGGIGINLTAANRCVILDSSWNPSLDQQNIFRIYRMGQKQNCFVYRIIAAGTMEEKIYSRAVTKQAMSYRVIDKQQVDRNFSMAELVELYRLSMPNWSKRPIPYLPDDLILKNLLINNSKIIYKYHTHNSLLDNKQETELTDEEKKEAWARYESEVGSNLFQNTQEQSVPAICDGNNAVSKLPVAPLAKIIVNPQYQVPAKIVVNPQIQVPSKIIVNPQNQVPTKIVVNPQVGIPNRIYQNPTITTRPPPFIIVKRPSEGTLQNTMKKPRTSSEF